MAITNPFVQKMIAIREEAMILLVEHGLYQQGWRFILTNGKTQVGICKHKEKHIGFSQHFLMKTGDEAITDTLLHEIAHALVGPSHGHDATWRSKAWEIGCNGERTCGEEAVSTAKYNYVIRCEGCGAEWKRYRMKRSNFGAKCTHCGTTVTIYKYERR